MVSPRLLLEHSPRKKPAAIEGKFVFFFPRLQVSMYWLDALFYWIINIFISITYNTKPSSVQAQEMNYINMFALQDLKITFSSPTDG